MKVFNLACAHGHRFEGWFASEADHQSQSARGLIRCPMCGVPDIQRLPSAPHVHRPKSSSGTPTGRAAAKAGQADAVEPAPVASSGDSGSGDSVHLPALLAAAHLQAMRRVLADTPDVGEQFPEEARRMHYGEAPERAIRGRATPDEARALVEEGIPVLPLALPDALKGTLQ